MNNCPSCEHELVNIIYGIPGQKLIDMAKAEHLALGGLQTSSLSPTLYCYGCQETY